MLQNLQAQIQPQIRPQILFAPGRTGHYIRWREICVRAPHFL